MKDYCSLGKKLSCGIKSGQFLLEEEYKDCRQVQEGKQGWRPNQFSAAIGHDSSRPCPLCHSSWHRNALSSLSPQVTTRTFSSESNVTAELQGSSGLQTHGVNAGCLVEPSETSWSQMLNLCLVTQNHKPVISCAFITLDLELVFFLSLEMSQSKPIFHALLLTYKI